MHSENNFWIFVTCMLYIILIGRKTERLGLIMAILPLSPPNHSSLSPPRPLHPFPPHLQIPLYLHRHVHGRYGIVLSISFTHCQSCLAPKFISPLYQNNGWNTGRREKSSFVCDRVCGSYSGKSKSPSIYLLYQNLAVFSPSCFPLTYQYNKSIRVRIW